MSTPFRLSAVLLAILFLLLPLHFAIAICQTSPQSELILCSNDETMSDQPTTTNTSELSWLCPHCGNYVSYQDLTCPQCNTQRPSLSSNQLELYKSVKKHPSFKKAGIALSIIGGGLACSGVAYVLLREHDPNTSSPWPLIIFLSTVIPGSILGGTGLVLLLASGGTKMEKLPKEQYPQLGYNWQDKFKTLGERMEKQSIYVPLFTMSFTF